AYLRIANIDGSHVKEYHYPSLKQDIQNGKNVITMDEENVYISLSDAGVAKIRLSDGALLDHFVPNAYEVDGQRVFTEDGYTNGVALDHCHLFLANGADGV